MEQPSTPTCSSDYRLSNIIELGEAIWSDVANLGEDWHDLEASEKLLSLEVLGFRARQLEGYCNQLGNDIVDLEEVLNG